MSDLIRTDTVFGKRVNIVGNISADLVLESLGKVYIKSRNKAQTLEELITSLVNQDPNTSTSKVKVIEGIEDLDTSEFKEGTFVFDKLSNILYLYIDKELLELINVAPEGTEYVKRTGDTMTGRLAIYVNNGPPLYVNSTQLVENLNAEYLNGERADSFTRRNKDEKIEGQWTFKRPTTFESNTLFQKDIVTHGSIGSPSFSTGFGGYGWRMDADTNTLTVDNLVVRKLMQVYELVINKISATNGSLWVTNAGKVALAQKLEIKEDSFFDSAEANRFCAGLPSGYAFIKQTTTYETLENEAFSTPSGENIIIKQNCPSTTTLSNAKLVIRRNNKESCVGSKFDSDNDNRYHLYSLFSSDFKFKCVFPIITRLAYRDYVNSPENFNIKNRISYIESYYKYFAKGDFYLVNFDSDSLPVFKAGDIIRCQKWTYGGIKYYDGVICNYVDNQYVIQLAPSILDIKTTVSYDSSLEPQYTVQNESINQDLYKSTVRTPKNGDILGLIEKDDSIVQIGNLWDSQRQNAVYITSTDNGAPFMDVLSGINRPDYSVIYYVPVFQTVKLYTSPAPIITGFTEAIDIPYTGDYYILENTVTQCDYTYFSYTNNSGTGKYLAKGKSLPQGATLIYYLSSSPNKDCILGKSEENFNILLENGGRIQLENKVGDEPFDGEYYLLLEEGLDKLTIASTRTTKARFGNLDGIQDEMFPINKQPYGYGLYGQSVFLTGEFYLNNGQSVADIGKDAIAFAVASANAQDNARYLLEQDLKRADTLLRNSTYSKKQLYTAGLYINNNAQMVLWGNQIMVATTQDEFNGGVAPTLLMENGKIRAKFIEVHDIHSDFGVNEYERYWLDGKEVFQGYTSSTVGDVIIYESYYYYIDNNEKVELTSAEVQRLVTTTDYRTYGWWLKPEGDGYLAQGNIRWDATGELEILGSLKLQQGRGIYVYSTPSNNESSKLTTIINGDSAYSLTAFNQLKKNRDIVIYSNITNVNNNVIYSAPISIEASQINYSIKIYALDITPRTRTETELPIKVTYTYEDDTTLIESFVISYSQAWTATNLSQPVKYVSISIDGQYDSVFVNTRITLITDLVTSQFGSNFLAVAPLQNEFLWTGQDKFIVNYGNYYLKINSSGIFINNTSHGVISSIDTTDEFNIFDLLRFNDAIAPQEFKKIGYTDIILDKYSPRVFCLEEGATQNKFYNVSADDSAIGIIFTIFREMYHTHTYKTWVKFMNQLLWYSKCDEDIVVDESVLLENEPIRVVYLGNSKWKSIDPHY